MNKNNRITTGKQQETAQKIRQQYLGREVNIYAQLQSLDRKVKRPGKITGYMVGIVGTLIMGTGMSMILVSGVMNPGIPVGIIGMVTAILAYPLYQRITKKRKETFAQEIFRLTDQLN